MIIGWAEVISAIAVIISAFIAMFTFVRTSRLRDTIYIENQRRVDLDRTREAFEAEINRLHEQIYRDEGRWRELNHIVVDSLTRGTQQASATINENSVEKFLRSMGVNPDVAVEDRFVFVLTPMNRREQGTFSTIQSVCQSIGLNVRRGDEVKVSGPLLPYILSEIVKSALIVANLNGRNPNVFYELGIAQALGKPCLLIAQSGEEVPFDVSHQQLVLYENEMDLRGKLSTALSQLAVGGHLSVQAGGKFSKPLAQDAVVILQNDSQTAEALQAIRDMPGYISSSSAPGSPVVYVRATSSSKEFINDVMRHLESKGLRTRGASLVSDPRGN